MIDWLLKNKEWLFSGIGVLVLGGLGKLLYDRFHRRVLSPVPGGVAVDAAPHNGQSKPEPAVVIRRSASVAPTTVLEKNLTGALEDWLNATVRIRIGDYYSVQAGNFPLRVEVTDIRMAKIRAEIGGGITDELAVELHVSLGGAVVYGGAGTVQVSTNKYLVPRFQFDQSPRALYLVSTKDHRSLFFCVSVTHINAHDGCADVSIVKTSISG